MTARHSVLLIDLDGTLVDSEPDLTAALNATLAEYGRAAVDSSDVRRMVGDGLVKLVERGFAATGGLPSEAVQAEAVARCLAHYKAAPTARSKPFPGAPEVLAALRKQGWRHAICTNKPEELSRIVLENLGLLPLVDAVVGGDSLPVRKPDPGHPLGTLERIGASPDQAVFLGDSINDLKAGRAAGLPVILVTFGYTVTPAAELGADALIDSFAGLPRALEQLAADS